MVYRAAQENPDLLACIRGVTEVALADAPQLREVVGLLERGS